MNATGKKKEKDSSAASCFLWLELYFMMLQTCMGAPAASARFEFDRVPIVETSSVRTKDIQSFLHPHDGHVVAGGSRVRRNGVRTKDTKIRIDHGKRELPVWKEHLRSTLARECKDDPNKYDDLTSLFAYLLQY